MRVSTMILLALAIGAAGCAAGSDELRSASSGGDDSDGGSTTGSGGSDGGGPAGSGSGGELTLGGTGTGGTPTGLETLCDGIDNDDNGIVDDVDKGKDGVCDCLRLATIGVKGKYGQGDVFAQWLDERSDFGAVALGSTQLSPALLGQYEVIVAQDLSVGFSGYDATQAAALKAWVEGGGGLMTLIGYEDPYSINNVNGLLSPMGMSYGSQQILASSNGTVPISSWMPHPVTEGVSLVGVRNGYPVQGPGTMLANGGGYNVLQATTVGAGHVVMWADEWITYDTEWLTHPEYQVELFWLNIIKYLTPPTQCQVPTMPVPD